MLEDALDEIQVLYLALREARPYVYQRIDHGNLDEWRSATARSVLGRVDAALESLEPESLR